MFNIFSQGSPLDISPQDAKAKLDGEPKPIVLDVREQWEYDFNRLDGAVHIPLGELQQRFRELDSEKEVIAYCHMGVRSLKATEFLEQQGFQKAKNLAGGIDAWSVQIDPSVPRYR